MRKALAILVVLAAVLFCASAGAEETRTAVIQLEGTDETIRETRYESPLGYALWYDADRYILRDHPAEDGPQNSTRIYPADSENVMPIYLDIIPARPNGPVGDDFLVQAPANMGVVTEAIDEMKLDSGITLRYCVGNKYAMHYEFFTASGSGDELQITLQCPVEAMEGHRSRLLRSLQSLEYLPDDEEVPSVEIRSYFGADLEASAQALSLTHYEKVVSEVPNQYSSDVLLLAGNDSVNCISLTGEGYSLFGAEVGMDIGMVQELFSQAPLDLSAAFDDCYIFEHRALGTLKEDECYDSCINVSIDANGNVLFFDWSTYTG